MNNYPFIIRKSDAPLSEPLPYTVYQCAQFALFCKRHNITFGNNVEYRAGIKQYYSNSYDAEVSGTII